MRLYALGDFNLLRGAPFRFLSFGDDLALGFDGAGDFVEADQRVEIAVRVLEARENAAPNGWRFRCLRRGFAGLEGSPCSVSQMPKTRRGVEGDAASAPLAELHEHIFGDEGDLGVAADELDL